MRFSPTMDDGSTTTGSSDTPVGPDTTIRAGPDDDREADDELARLRASLGFIEEAPQRVIADRYAVEELVGRGAMGSVYRAHDNKLPRFVALKLVRARPFSDPTVLQRRLAREAEMLARVEHPNVVTVYDIGDHHGDLYLAMQYVAGRTLRSWQREREPDVDALLDAYLQAARGLSAAHAVGVVHRDFKPENVLIGPTGIVHVVDFGIAAAMRDSERGLPATASDGTVESPTVSLSTRAGALIGTVPYMSPQQLEGLEAEPRDDQFSFCVSLWEAFTGKRPYHGNDLFQLVAAMQDKLVPDRELPRSVRAILMRGLSYRREDRFARMDSLIAALESARESRLRKRNAGIATAGVTFAGMVGWFAAGLSPSGETCESFRAQVDEIWGTQSHRALRDHAEIDPEAVMYAIDKLDDLRERWEADAAALCEDRRSPPPESAQRRCLENWLEDLHRHVELLVEHGDARTLALVPELLANLEPPGGDWCALRPATGVDPEVWRLARGAREAAQIGDSSRAMALLDRADERAGEVAAGHESASERAEVALARAEVLARSGEADAALVELRTAEQQALGSVYSHGMFEAWVWMAKLSLFASDASVRASGWQHVERAGPLIGALELGDLDPLRGELHEACGMAERARGEQDEAIVCHQRAAELYAAIDRAPMVARAYNNIGANAMEIGDGERATEAFQRALAELDAAGVPPSYPIRLESEYNLGMLAVQRDDLAGISNFEVVLDHGSPDRRLEAMARAAQLSALEKLDFTDEATEWAEAALAELEARTDEVDVALVLEVETIAGAILLFDGDPRGEELLTGAIERAESVDSAFALAIQHTWIEALEQQSRCDEAAERLTRVDEWSRSVGLEPEMMVWRRSRQASLCRG